MQILICLCVMAVAAGIGIAVFAYTHRGHADIKNADVLKHSDVVEHVNRRIIEMINENAFNARDDIEYELIKRRRERYETAVHNCVYCIDKDKIIVKEIIVEILKELFKSEEDFYKVYPFNSPAIEPMWMFEILIEKLFPVHKKDSLSYIIKKYDLDRSRKEIEDGESVSYFIDEQDLLRVYQAEVTEPLTYHEALTVAATLVYEDIFGADRIDTLRALAIDGLNIGASGSVMENGNTTPEGMKWKAPRSVWINYSGKYIHLTFFNLGDAGRVQRIVQLLARYNNPGQLTEKRTYLVNTMYDKSRILAVRPPAGEYWAMFIRKFNIKKPTLHSLICPVQKDAMGNPIIDENGEPVPLYTNTQLPENMITLAMQGQVTTGFTGRQSSGKTTMMIAAISAADARLTLRILEMAPEMYLREVYPRRNIFSVAETVWTTAAELQDALKKSDAAISIVGEVATDIIAARMLQMGQVSAIYTIFSHHAIEAEFLVESITNSVVAASNGAATYDTVLPQVVDVIKLDVHLDFDVDGNRYIERITEICRKPDPTYPERLPGEPVDEYQVRLTKRYYEITTTEKRFYTHNILVFDKNTWEYKPVEWVSRELTEHIFKCLPRDSVDYWRSWVLQNFGGVA